MKNSNLIKKIKYFIIYKLLQYIILYSLIIIKIGYDKEFIGIFTIVFILILLISIVVNIVLHLFIKKYNLAIIVVADIISYIIYVLYGANIMEAL
jgi:hypothetical protein